MLKIKLLYPEAIMPTRATKTDAGLDVYSFNCIDITIQPGADFLFPLGWSCEFPDGHALIMFNKSGRATKNKLQVGACVIDSGYRGEVHVHLHNLGTEPVVIKSGEKIAQAILIPCWVGKPTQVTEFENENTDRGTGGFGSSGLYENTKIN